jgi:UDP-N-acetylbacillosamine N-acetyltransferase
MRSRLIIWGAGGHGKTLLDAALGSNLWEDIVFVDDREHASYGGYSVLRPESAISNTEFIVGIGMNTIRARVHDEGIRLGLRPITLIHRAATVSERAVVGPGTVVLAGAVVNPDAEIGDAVIINSGAIVEHDCRIGNTAHISPRVALGGGVIVGEKAHVGIGAVVLPGVKIGAGATVGAGAVVLGDVPASATVVGVPARILSKD